MSEPRRYAEVVASLPAGEPNTVDALGGAAVALVHVVGDSGRRGADAPALLERSSTVVHDLLETAAALLTHGGPRVLRLIGAALQRIATATSDRELQAGRVASDYLLARVTWALGAISLAAEREDALVELAAVTRPSRRDGTDLPLVIDNDLRHPDATDRGADAAFRQHEAWCAGLSLVEHSPWLTGEFTAALAEADLLYALLAARVSSREVYSAGAAWPGGNAQQRLARRARHHHASEMLARLFGVEASGLTEAVESAYQRVVVGPNTFRAPLFGPREA